MEDRKLLGSRWFSGRDTIGIVVVDNGFEHKAYIGVGKGDSIFGDLISIMDYGTSFPLKQAKELCNIE